MSGLAQVLSSSRLKTELMLIAKHATSQPWEGNNVRSRLWALILRELPFPFREIGIEMARVLRWVDQTAARFWIGLARSPAWYLVAVTGAMAFLLTGLLFFNFVSSHDPTLAEVANRSERLVPLTREHLEDSGDWAAQDKWRLAHFFVDHRPVKRNKVHSDDLVLTNFATGAVISHQEAPRTSGFRSRFTPSERNRPSSNLVVSDPDVTLELNAPRAAEVPKRLVYGNFIREPGLNSHPIRRAVLRSREPQLLVQAEWSYGSDCNYEPARQPVRRIIPVPDPQWDEVPAVTDDRRPDLSFQMSMLREFLPATGEFPPHSRNVSVTATSEFPDSFNTGSFDTVKRANPLIEEFTRWTRTHANRVEPDRPAESYVDRVGVEEDTTPVVDEADRDLRRIPSFAEVALRLEIRAPESTLAGRVNQSSLLLQNEGGREIPLVTVRESLAGLETVTDAIPPARVDQFDNSLERKVLRLEPGKDRRLEIVWRPDAEGRRTHSATVTVTSAVGALTEIVPPVGEQPMPSVAPEPIPVREPEESEPAFEPEPIREPEPAAKVHPKLSFEVQSLPRAVVDDLVEIGLVVRNMGDVPLHRVRVVAKLPEQLHHRHGTEVEFTINSIPVRGSERTVLRVVAHAAGRAVCQLHVAAVEPTEADSQAVIEIGARSIAPKVTKVEPVRPKTVPTPQRTPPRIAPVPNCCCQVVPVIFDPWFIP